MIAWLTQESGLANLKRKTVSFMYALCFHQAIVKVIKSSLEWSKDSMYHGCNRDIPRPYGNLLCEVNESQVLPISYGE